jgi:protein gp37
MKTTSIRPKVITINPITGCDRHSPGCKNCYALRMIPRLQSFGNKKYRNGAAITCHPGVMEAVLKRKKPTFYFLNSMSDTFHKDVPVAFLKEIFTIMNMASWHTFHFLTKRSGRLAELTGEFNYTPNIIPGVTVESNAHLYRIENLKKVPSRRHFLTFEPLLDGLDDLTPGMLGGIDWVVAGGESGSGAREMKPEWARTLRGICKMAGVPFWLKQMGSHGRKPNKGGNLLDGKSYEEWPEFNL